MIVANKVWGTTECLLSLPMIQVHRIRFVRGGTCSHHYHVNRYNAFYVLEGRLEIAKGNPIHTYDRLEVDQLYVIPPGVPHQFKGLSAGVALEIYFPGDLDPNDIVRLTEGFLAP